MNALQAIWRQLTNETWLADFQYGYRAHITRTGKTRYEWALRSAKGLVLYKGTEPTESLAKQEAALRWIQHKNKYL